MAKDVFTTGEVAEICNVDLKTVIKWFEEGLLDGYKVPGSNYRRIPKESLATFMKENDIPMGNLERSGKKKVLIVDDELDIVEFLEGSLSGDPRLEVYSATNGCYACFQIGVLKPDIILLDVKMPMMDGVEVGNWIRANPVTQGIKILMVTGYAEGAEAERLRKCGVDGFLKKPVEVKVLQDTVLELLGLQGQPRKQLADTE